MCKQALEGDQMTTGDGLVRGFADSVYLMVATPYLLLSVVIWMIWRSARKSAPPPTEG